MVDRVINYVGQIPLDTDVLNTNKFGMIGLGMLIQAVLGTSTVCDGLACTPTSPGSLDVLLGPGSLYEYENVDATAYGSIADDTTHQIMKQGIQIGTATLSCPAPTTTGYSINYLVEINYQDNDTGSTVLPYYNASNPAVAYNGPNNTGVSQNTIRQGELVVTVKPGTAATTGTQTTPSPDAGFTGIWVVTVAYGQTAITSGNIAKYSGAPFINYKLPQLSPFSALPRTALTGNTTFYVSTTGSDSSGTGTSGAPWATIQHAVNVIQSSYDLAGYTVTIQLADGTYSAGFVVSAPWVGGSAQNVIINGDSITPSNVVISCSTTCAQGSGTGCGFTIQNMKLSTSGAGASCIGLQLGANVLMGPGIIFGAATSGVHIFASTEAVLIIDYNYSITGSALSHIEQLTGSSIDIQNGVVGTLSGTLTFTDFVSTEMNANLYYAGGNSYTGGTVTGTTYTCALNSTINTQGGGANFFPGNVTSTPVTGGQYA